MLSKGDLEQPALDLSIRAARSRPRRAKTDSRERRDAPPERPVVPPTNSIPPSSDTDNTDIDPLDTHCSEELRLAQDTDSDIEQMKKGLKAKPLKKPTPKEITHHGPKFKALWSKWGALNVIEDVLYMK